jgi:hypothetical protein
MNLQIAICGRFVFRCLSSSHCRRAAVLGTCHMGYCVLLCLSVIPYCTNTVLRLVSCSRLTVVPLWAELMLRGCAGLPLRRPRSIPSLSMWDLWSIHWHCKVFFALVFPCQDHCTSAPHSLIHDRRHVILAADGVVQ